MNNYLILLIILLAIILVAIAYLLYFNPEKHGQNGKSRKSNPGKTQNERPPLPPRTTEDELDKEEDEVL